MANNNQKDDSLLCGLAFESAAAFGSNEAINEAIAENCSFDIKEEPAQTEAKKEEGTQKNDLLCGLVLESAAMAGTAAPVGEVIKEVCDFGENEAPAEAKEESHPLACEVTIDNAGVPTEAMAEILKDECGTKA